MAIKYLKFKGYIRTKTGLKIGGSKDNVNIGGIDNIVIRNPKDNMPYIPGSSIKGKMRFLMEWAKGKVNGSSVHTCDDSNCEVCGLFGTTKSKGEESRPTRLIVRDAMLKDEIVEKAKRGELNLTEEKIENSINRLEGKAANPRTMERVVPGIDFKFEAVIRLFDNDNNDVDKWKNLLIGAMKLLQKDYLGGSGSRGYGKVIFVDMEGKENAITINGEPYALN